MSTNYFAIALLVALKAEAIGLRPGLYLTPSHLKDLDWQLRVNCCAAVFKSNWVAAQAQPRTNAKAARCSDTYRIAA